MTRATRQTSQPPPRKPFRRKAVRPRADGRRPTAAAGTVADLEAFTRIAETLGRASSTHAALHDTLGTTLQALGVNAGVIHLLEPDGKTLAVAAARGLPEAIVDTLRRLPVNASLPGMVVKTRGPLHVPDVAADPRILRAVDPAVLRGEGLRSFVCVPLWAQDRALGALGVCSRHRRRFQPRQIKLLEALGHQIGVALEGARLLREARGRATRSAVLNDIWAIVSSSLSLEQVYEGFADAVHRLLPFDRLSVALFEPEAAAYRIIGLRTAIPTGLNPQDRLPAAESLNAWVREHRRARILPELRAVSPLRGERLLARAGFRCGVQAPLIAQDEAIGTLDAWSLEPGRYGEVELADLGEVARLLAVAISNARLLRDATARADRLAALHEVAGTIARERDLRRALNAIADRLRTLIPHDSCGIFLREGEVLSPAVWRGGFDRAEPPAIRLGEGITGWVAETGSPQLVNDAHRHPRALAIPGTPARAEALLSAPLLAEDRILGVVTLVRYERPEAGGAARFGLAELDLLTTFAHQAALAIEKTRLMTEAVERADRLAALNARLQESEAQYRLVTEEARDVIYTRDLEGRLTFVNPQVEALLGYRPEELIGRPIAVVTTPETQAAAAERARRLQAGEPVEHYIQGELVRKDGGVVPVEVNTTLLHRDGQAVGLLGIVRDVSARREMELELKRRQRELEALNEVGRAIGASLELDRTLDLILDKARDLLGVPTCGILRLDEASGQLTPLRSRGTDLDREGEPRFPAGEGLAGLAAQERTPVMSTDVLADPRAHPTALAVRNGLRSALAIPLAVPDRVFGVLVVFRHEAGGFTEAEIRLASAFADQAAIALVNASLYEGTQRNLAQLAALREAVEAVSSELHRGLLLQKLIVSAVPLLGGDIGSVGLYEAEENRLRLAAVHNLPPELLGQAVPPGAGVAGRVLETGEPLMVERYSTLSRRIEFSGVEEVWSVVSVPIRYQGRLVGTFTIGSRNADRRFTERDVETLAVFAKHAGIAIENARMYRECQAYSQDLEQRVMERTHDLAEQKAFTDGVVEALPLGLYVVDRAFRVVTCNRAGEGELGIGPGQLRGMSLPDLLPEAKREAAREALEEIFRRGALSRSEEEFVEGGTTRILRMTRAPLRTDSGAVTYAILLIEDITDRKRLERQVLAAEKLAAVGSLAAGVAHELNNPLATIAGCAEGLLDRLQDPGLRAVEGIADFAEYLRLIEEETYRCKEITGALLQFVREPGTQREPVDVNAALEKALTLVGHQPRFRALTIRRELAAGLPPVRANEGQIRQVFLSLLLNALEATPGEGTLTVRTLLMPEADGPKVAVEFRDQGSGIAPENLPRIFEPFFTTKLAGKGTGLGLAICQGIVTEHGGRIDVQSALGAGSAFCVVLPAEPQASAGARPGPNASAPPARPLEAGG